MFRAQSKTYKNFCGILAESKGQCWKSWFSTFEGCFPQNRSCHCPHFLPKTFQWSLPTLWIKCKPRTMAYRSTWCDCCLPSQPLLIPLPTLFLQPHWPWCCSLNIPHSGLLPSLGPHPGMSFLGFCITGSFSCVQAHPYSPPGSCGFLRWAHFLQSAHHHLFYRVCLSLHCCLLPVFSH